MIDIFNTLNNKMNRITKEKVKFYTNSNKLNFNPCVKQTQVIFGMVDFALLFLFDYICLRVVFILARACNCDAFFYDKMK